MIYSLLDLPFSQLSISGLVYAFVVAVNPSFTRSSLVHFFENHNFKKVFLCACVCLHNAIVQTRCTADNGSIQPVQTLDIPMCVYPRDRHGGPAGGAGDGLQVHSPVVAVRGPGEPLASRGGPGGPRPAPVLHLVRGGPKLQPPRGRGHRRHQLLQLHPARQAHGANRNFLRSHSLFAFLTDLTASFCLIKLKY